MFEEAILDQSFGEQKLLAAVAKTFPALLPGGLLFPEAACSPRTKSTHDISSGTRTFMLRTALKEASELVICKTLVQNLGEKRLLL